MTREKSNCASCANEDAVLLQAGNREVLSDDVTDASALDLDSPPFYPDTEFPGANRDGASPDTDGGQFRL